MATTDGALRMLAALAGAALCLPIASCSSESTPGGPDGAGAGSPGSCTDEGAFVYCWPGEPVNRGVGECVDGIQQCVGGQWTECADYVLPEPEDCNDGLDNNCNGVSDEGCSCDTGDVRACYTGPASTRGLGICTDGEQSCTTGTWSEDCVGEVVPDEESCDQVDNDCNGLVDDGCACTDGTTQPCYTGPNGTIGVGDCHGGQQTCTNGQWDPTCSGEETPDPESCNGDDDDCDGSTDEGNPGGGGGCSTGLQGVCAPGTLDCQGGSLICEPNQTASSEVCNGDDDDCDGSTDEGNPGGGGSCSTGQQGVCAAGTTTCQGGTLQCVQNQSSSTEVCNGDDDDCDGSTDEGNPGGGGACSTGLLGVCAAGTRECQGGSLICEPDQSASSEVCNGDDDDCDGSTDEGSLCQAGYICSGGQCILDSGTCPYLYTWDGTEFSFETDIYGSGKLGAPSAIGTFKPNPDDYYVLTHNPAILAGSLELRLVEERPEANYLDMVRLVAADVPQGFDIYTELYGLATAYASLEDSVHTVMTPLQPPPTATHVNSNTSVLAEIEHADDVFAVMSNDANLDFDYNTIELDLGDLSGAPQIKLVINAMTVFPSSPEGLKRKEQFGPRTKLEVPDQNGDWVGVPKPVAYMSPPKAARRPYVLDLSNAFVTNDYRVRLTWLFKTYIDAISLDTTLDATPTLQELPLERADLRYYGHSLRVGGEVFEFVYGSISQAYWTPFPGAYTRFGKVESLLGAVDDKFVVYWAGDEIAVRFTPPAALAPGTRRRFILHSNGYYKDMTFPGSWEVEPLPFAAMSNYPYDPQVEHYPDDPDHVAYRQTYNTRVYP